MQTLKKNLFGFVFNVSSCWTWHTAARQEQDVVAAALVGVRVYTEKGPGGV